jgi:hypothetical protein
LPFVPVPVRLFGGADGLVYGADRASFSSVRQISVSVSSSSLAFRRLRRVSRISSARRLSATGQGQKLDFVLQVGQDASHSVTVPCASLCQVMIRVMSRWIPRISSVGVTIGMCALLYWLPATSPPGWADHRFRPVAVRRSSGGL